MFVDFISNLYQRLNIVTNKKTSNESSYITTFSQNNVPTNQQIFDNP